MNFLKERTKRTRKNERHNRKENKSRNEAEDILNLIEDDVLNVWIPWEIVHPNEKPHIIQKFAGAGYHILKAQDWTDNLINGTYYGNQSSLINARQNLSKAFDRIKPLLKVESYPLLDTYLRNEISHVLSDLEKARDNLKGFDYDRPLKDPQKDTSISKFK